jgi:DNA polymerase-3 subunit epsilon
MEYIAIIDTETSGLDVSKEKVLEIAAVLYHIPTRSILAQASTLCYAEENPVYDINHIEIEALKKTPAKIQLSGEMMVAEIFLQAEALIAHNASFDKKWIETIPNLQLISQSKKWICTKNDVIWPIRKGLPLTLINICASLGVPIVDTHRALTDCLLLTEAIACITDISYFLDKSGEDRITYYANINYDQRQLAKDLGFQWDNIKKVWFARLTPDEAFTMPFMVYPSHSIEKP